MESKLGKRRAIGEQIFDTLTAIETHPLKN